jgi:hypothetical protein
MPVLFDHQRIADRLCVPVEHLAELETLVRRQYGSDEMLAELRLLLSMQQISTSLRDATLLTFAGNFSNVAVPGTTGGDLYKAYHIARQTHKTAEGVAIVFLDRAVGLISFLLLALTLGIRILQVFRALPGVLVPGLGFRRPTAAFAERAFQPVDQRDCPPP